MLQVRNLVKRYTTKGETVTALDGVTLDFPEKGMVFLIGKSGSGKSTLLNVSGGLDEPDEGEIIVKGKSSKDFSKSDFDSYRNTYVGFVFQEYNILNELTVSENIALAVELQGKKRDETLVGRILEEVDLKGLGDRRPNTLSGGQKQRVAIARALVKDPEIIMADEPTGALDSATGAQVLDTLKKLSEEKLVVVVSHDRDFAERYADRIIELMDGKVVSDMSRGGAARTNLRTLSEKKLSIRSGSELTDREIADVVAFLKTTRGNLVISAERQEEIASDGAFVQTAAEPLPPQKDESKFIRSRFPFRYALKMGASGLKFKPVRLAFTILLATVAFIVFGVFSTFVTFDTGKVGTRALNDSAFGAAVLVKKGFIRPGKTGDIDKTRYFGTGATVSHNASNIGEYAHFTTEEFEALAKKYPEMGFVPAVNFDSDWCEIRDNFGAYSLNVNKYYNEIKTVSGFTEISYIRDDPDFPLLYGRYPENSGEIVISELLFDAFRSRGYRDATDLTSAQQTRTIGSFSDLDGSNLHVYLGLDGQNQPNWALDLKIVGVAGTPDRLERFDYIRDADYNVETENMPKISANELESFRESYAYSFASLVYAGDGFFRDTAPFSKAKHNYEVEIGNLQYIADPAAFTYRENAPDGVYFSALYAPLRGHQSRSRILMEKLHEREDETFCSQYLAPYPFISGFIAEAKHSINSIVGTIGAAAAALGLFAAFLLFNFISVSINAKKKDIGILRAVGARGIDVYKIFMVEGAIIVLVCLILGCIGSFFACGIVNTALVGGAGLFECDVLIFDMTNVLILCGIAAVTTLFATAVPVKLNSRKKPVEAIRAI